MCVCVFVIEQWNTRSKKKRVPQQQQRSFAQDDGYSMESTDTEDDSLSHPSAVPSPAPSQRSEFMCDYISSKI